MSNEENMKRVNPARVEAKPQVLAEMETGDAACGRLDSAIDTLEVRLSDVLRSTPPIPTTDEKDGVELVRLAYCIKSINRAIFTQAGRIEDIIERLEI